MNLPGGNLLRILRSAKPAEYHFRRMADSFSAARLDPVVERYLRDVDRTLLRRNLALSPEQRLHQLQELARLAEELRRAGKKASGPRSP